MAKIKDFLTKYADKIFAIDPAFAGGCGWAIINMDAEFFNGQTKKPLVHKCNILKPFSSVSNLITMNELAIKLTDIWRADNGYSREPKIMVIERPVIYPGSLVRFSSLMDLSIFVGIISEILNPELILIPIPNEWKGIKSKEDTKTLVLNTVDSNSKKNIERDISSIAIKDRHNVFDALGLGLYAGMVANNNIAMPKLHYKNKTV